MKRQTILISLFAILFAASCAESKVVEKEVNDEPLPEIIANNLKERPTSKDESDKIQTRYLGSVTLNNIIGNYYDVGLMVLSENGYVNFYSVPHKEYHFKNMFVENLTDYSVTKDPNIGYFLTIRYKENLYVIDTYGNLIVKGEYHDRKYTYTLKESLVPDIISDSPVSFSFGTQMVNTNCLVTVYSSSGVTAHFGYRKTGEIYGVYDGTLLPPIIDTDAGYSPIVDPDHYLDYGDIYKDTDDEKRRDLSMYGLPGYHLVKNSQNTNYWTVFNKLDEKVFSVALEDGKDIMIVDGKIVLQEKHETITDIDYTEDTKAYCLKTLQINLLNGETAETPVKYVIESGTPYCNAEGVYKYLNATIRRIDELNHLLPYTEQVILDAHLNILYNVTNMQIDQFIKLDDNHHYNQNNKIIYNGKMEETLYIGSIDPTYVPDENIFIGKDNGYYGAINPDGKVVIPFKYTEIKKGNKTNEYVFQNGFGFGKNKDGSWERITPRDNYSKSLGNTVVHLYDDCYLYGNGFNHIVSDYESDYLSFNAAVALNVQYTVNLGQADYTFILGDNSTIYMFAKTELLNSSSLIRNSGLDLEGSLSTDKYYPLTISLGDSTLLVGGQHSYFKIYGLSSSKMYEFTFDKSVKLSYSTDGYNYNSSSSYTVFRYQGKVSTLYLDLSYPGLSNYTVKNVELNIKEISIGDSQYYRQTLSLNSRVVDNLNELKTRYYTFTPTTSGTYYFKFDCKKLPVITSSVSLSKINDFTYSAYLSASSSYTFNISSVSLTSESVGFTVANAL